VTSSSDFARVWQEFTPNEKRVLTLRCRGMTRTETAEKMGISESTVRNHITAVSRRIYEELGLMTSHRAKRRITDISPICWRYGYELGLRHERIRKSDNPPDDDGVK
jgi:DNA-binding CsgD family transcriptional regulator